MKCWPVRAGCTRDGGRGRRWERASSCSSRSRPQRGNGRGSERAERAGGKAERAGGRAERAGRVSGQSEPVEGREEERRQSVGGEGGRAAGGGSKSGGASGLSEIL
jgi:hypothetical protein